jgi:hypothetical protein
MYVSAYDGRTLLHATSDVESRGRGPMELHGVRDGPKRMRVLQRIYKKGGGHITLRTGASLHFTDVGEYFGGSYRKVHQLVRFELRRVLPGGGLGPPLRVSPKHNYCLRDLARTRPGRRSPLAAHYPACNQDPHIKRDVLGTSVGWSDIYPADYDKQYIDVTGLRGCFVFRMTVDPKNLLFESSAATTPRSVASGSPSPARAAELGASRGRPRRGRCAGRLRRSHPGGGSPSRLRRRSR